MNIRNFLTSPLRQLNYFQLENYNVGRFFHIFFSSFSSGPLRMQTVWTNKLLLLICVSLALVISVVLISSMFAILLAGIMFLFSYFFFGLYVVAASLITWPFETLVRWYIVHKAIKKLHSLNTLIVIAVAGSYGKTTIKEALKAVLSTRKRVVATEGSINTPIGIARLILQSVDPSTEIFIVEMGEHYPGDIKELTNIVHPSITVVTGINEAHLDRFGTIDSLTTGICEAIDGTLMQGVVILNADNERVVNAYSSHIGSRRVLWYSAHNNSKCLYSAEKIHFHIDGTGHTFEVIKDSVSLGPLSVQLLGGYAIGVALCALEVADLFSIPIRDVREGLRTFESVSHRLEPIKTSNALVIDDSYNGNPEGVKYAIEALSKFEGRRKVYVTPGLVELGTESERIHIEIGKHLAVVVDIVVLIKNSVTPFIAKGLVEGGFKGQTLIYESAVEAHKSMAELVKSGDVVLFQNDWPDNYL